jgi:hypothetical protein
MFKCVMANDDPDGQCLACVNANFRSPWIGICTKAHFFDVVNAGTCNFICKYLHSPTLLLHPLFFLPC